jgi:hypothetical protein
MQLDNTISPLGSGYALGNIVAAEYLLDAIPSDTEIEHDLLQIAMWLGQIYRAADEGLYVPGDSPDVADIEDALETIADPLRRRRGSGPRLTAAEREVIAPGYRTASRAADYGAPFVTTTSESGSELPKRGGAKGTRTPDLLDANESRYQLRHSP